MERGFLMNYENEFLDKIENGVEFSEEELRDMPWSFTIVDTIESNEIYKRRRNVSTIFKVKDRFFRLDWVEDLGQYQEHEFEYQPYEVDKIEKQVTKYVTEYVKKGA